MWIYKNNPARPAAAITSPVRTTWREAWLMVRDATRPFPEARTAVLAVVERLLAECDAAGGSPARPEFVHESE